MAELDSGFADRLGDVITRCAKRYVAPDLAEELQKLVSPAALAVIAAIVPAYILGHLVGVGILVDAVIAVIGFWSVGCAIFTGLDELFESMKLTYGSSDDGLLEQAAQHLGRAISILGVQAVLALLLKKAPTTGRVKTSVPEPQREGGWFYKPKVSRSKDIDRETGSTSHWGDITLAFYGDRATLEVIALHEAVHSFLAPKFYPLRQFRVENRIGSYSGSSLVRFVEEALAETYAAGKTQGWAKSFTGMSFPVQSGYVSVFRPGMPRLSDTAGNATYGKGFIPEGASLIGKGWTAIFGFEVWYKEGGRSVDPKSMIDGGTSGLADEEKIRLWSAMYGAMT